MSYEVKSPMPAKVFEVHVNEGDTVDEEDVLVTLESMKMEIPVETEIAGVVSSVKAVLGSTVAKGDVLVVID